MENVKAHPSFFLTDTYEYADDTRMSRLFVVRLVALELLIFRFQDTV